MSRIRGAICLVAGMVLSALAAVAALAEDYPSRPITLVVPYPAGGGLDALARMLGRSSPSGSVGRS